MKNNLPTEAGQTKPKPKTAYIDAINQVFALFQLNFHNQYFKAFSNEKDLNYIKKLWLESLQRFEPAVILQATKKIIETKEFLPTLRTMIEACEKISHQELPDVHTAYLEACQAPSPKASAKWSHLAVYYAGKASDWYFLQNNTEQVAFPVFKEKYLEICHRVNLGEKLQTPSQEALPADIHTPLKPEENLQKLTSLKKALDL